MKKLNRKGFTLVELLAVIVILAIIVGLVFPQVMNAMDNSRISAIHSSAKGVVKWWDNAKVADSLVPESQKQIPSDVLTEVTSTWKCIDSVVGGTSGKNLFDLAGLSYNDLVTSRDTVAIPGGAASWDGPKSDAGYLCSGVMLNEKGELEVILFAKQGGRYYISGKTTYAYSKDDAGRSE